MNTTTATLLRSILKIGSGYLASKGIMNDATGEVIIAGLIAAISVLWGVLDKRPNPALTPPAPLLLVIGAGLAILVAGCQTTNTPGRILASTAQTVDVAMKGYMQCVKAGLIKPEQENNVRAAYTIYQTTEAAAESACLAYAKTGDKAAWDRAAGALQAAQSDLVTLIDLLTPKKP